LHSSLLSEAAPRAQAGPATSPAPDAGAIDSAALERELRQAVTGDVGFDAASRALYATDASNYRQVPIGVVFPKTIDDVIAAVAVCRRHGAPVLPRGCGTSLSGQCCNVAVVLDMTKHLNRIVALDPAARTARVQPGVVLDTLRDAAEKHHLTFAPDPSTHTHNTLGGMLGNNSCGVHSVMGGRTSDNVIELDVLLYDGTRLRVGATSEAEWSAIIAEGGRRGAIYHELKALRDAHAQRIRDLFPKVPRKVSGYALDELLPENGGHVARALVGTEGTCVIVLEATVRLVASPPGRTLLVLGYPDVFSAGDHVMEVLAHQPIGLEGIDDRLVADMKAMRLHPEGVELLPKGNGWLLVEFGGADDAESKARAQAAMQALKQAPNPPSIKLYDDPAEEKLIWTVRAAGLGATAHVPNKNITWEGWEDAAVPPEKLGDYLREFRALLETHGYEADLYGHFGQGCVHTRIDFDLQSAQGIANFRAFLDQAADLVVRYGGSFSGEHGDGQAKAEFLQKMYGPELVAAFEAFKAIWDPAWKMNPGKVVRPFRADQNLRLGAAYNPPRPLTWFRFPKDDGNFARVSLRCVGIGNCRREHGETMCPSWRVTHDEKHSTRGRARLLFEMLQGDVIKDGWRSEEVKEALDLCLACKGCKGDCPVQVDMATYKAEFLSHYFEGRLRPVHAYAFGLIDVWARIAAFAPAWVNLLTHAPGLKALAKAVVHMPAQRDIPEFAAQTFRSRFTLKASGKPPVLLWPDTFNNHFHPETLHAAVRVLEDAGFAVQIPRGAFCCGRPLYDFGMLDLARRRLQRILCGLANEIAAGIPIVVLEPACAAVFRDELVNLLPSDAQAQRLSTQTYLLAEFLQKKAPHYQPPTLQRQAIVHCHCHHKALMKTEADQRLLGLLGLDFDLLDSGCCGMAGSFGFERDKYAVSIAVGERVLLPAVRNAADATLIIADGYSCREQIAQTTSRRALHLAEVLAMAIDGRCDARLPEAQIVEARARAQRQAKLRLAGFTGIAVLAGLLAVAWRKRRLSIQPFERTSR